MIVQADVLVSSELALAEVPCVFHRHYGEGSITANQCQALCVLFEKHAAAGLWIFIPMGRLLLEQAAERIRNLPQGVFLRAGDAIHLCTARDHGEREVWTNDRRMLAAAPHFGIAGRNL